MPRIPRKYLDTSFFHIMSQGINRTYIFNNPIDIKYYIKNMYDLKNKYNIKIVAYCIMNNHTHILLQSESTDNVGKYMHGLNTRYGQYYNKKYNRVGYVFRDRYKAEGIYSEEQLNNCIRYIYNNPVKAGICKSPEEYKYSNYKKIEEGENDNYNFLDVDEEKDALCNRIVYEFLKINEFRVEDLKKEDNASKLKELIIMLREKYNISFRTIGKTIQMNRETTRRKYNKR